MGQLQVQEVEPDSLAEEWADVMNCGAIYLRFLQHLLKQHFLS